MTTDLFQFTTRSLAIAVSVLAVILAAYVRGEYLFGVPGGVLYALAATAIAGLFHRGITYKPFPKKRLILLTLFTIPVVLHFAFPTYLNPNAGYVVHKHAQDRNARAELAALFASDPAYHDLSVSTQHTKVIVVEIRGSVPTNDDLARVHAQVQECKLIEHCFVRWEVDVLK